jgi:hypothetical protein
MLTARGVYVWFPWNRPLRISTVPLPKQLPQSRAHIHRFPSGVLVLALKSSGTHLSATSVYPESCRDLRDVLIG